MEDLWALSQNESVLVLQVRVLSGGRNSAKTLHAFHSSQQREPVAGHIVLANFLESLLLPYLF